jgi:hypothetical protein
MLAASTEAQPISILSGIYCGRLVAGAWPLGIGDQKAIARIQEYPNHGNVNPRVYSGFRPALRKWRRSFAVNAWKIYLGRRLCLRPMGEFHADAGTRDSCVDKSQPSVRRMAFVDVQAAPKCSLPQSVAVQPCAGSHASRPKYPVSRSIARTGSKPT